MELMVGLTVGFIVIGGIMTIYTQTAGSSASTISSARLNQELNAIMQLMTNDIRRAGYWADFAPSSSNDKNPFNDSTLGYQLQIGTWSSKPCVTYTYDLDGIREDSDGDSTIEADEAHGKGQVGLGNLSVDTSYQYMDSTNFFDVTKNIQTNTTNTPNSRMELFGFRYKSSDSALQMRKGGTAGEAFSCATGNWEALNDWEDSVAITAFSIDSAGTNCINSTQGYDWKTTGTTTTFCADTANVAAAITARNVVLAAETPPGTPIPAAATPATDDTIVEIRQVNITLEGELTSDSSVNKTLSQTIRVRNDRAFSWP